MCVPFTNRRNYSNYKLTSKVKLWSPLVPVGCDNERDMRNQILGNVKAKKAKISPYILYKCFQYFKLPCSKTIRSFF